MKNPRRVIQVIVSLLVVLLFLLPTIWVIVYSLPAKAQYPKNAQVQRFSDGRVVVSTSPGAAAGPIRNVPQVTYGSTTYQQHYVEQPMATLAQLGGYAIPTSYIINSQPHYAPPMDYSRSKVVPSVMTICTHNGVGADQVTRCTKYK